MQGPERCDHSAWFRLIPAHAGDDGDRSGLVGQAARGHRREHAVRTKLDVRGHASRLERANTIEEPDRAADVSHPVVRCTQLSGFGELSRDVRTLEPSRERYLKRTRAANGTASSMSKMTAANRAFASIDSRTATPTEAPRPPVRSESRAVNRRLPVVACWTNR